MGSPGQDERGRHEPANKTSSEKVDHVKKFIDEIPKYESHYTRSQIFITSFNLGQTVSSLH